MRTRQLAFILTAGTIVFAAAADPAQKSSSVTPPCCRHVEPGTPVSDQSVYLLDSKWTSDLGREVKLSQFRGRIQVVALFFTQCEYSCPVLVHDLVALERQLPPELAGEVDFLLVSLDPKRDTAEALSAYRAKQKLSKERWTLLRATADDVRELAALLGINYADTSTGQIAHSNAITILNREGEIVAQHQGLKQNPSLIIDSIGKAAGQK